MYRRLIHFRLLQSSQECPLKLITRAIAATATEASNLTVDKTAKQVLKLSSFNDQKQKEHKDRCLAVEEVEDQLVTRGNEGVGEKSRGEGQSKDDEDAPSVADAAQGLVEEFEN